MKIIKANYILTPTALLKQQAIAYDKTIQAIAPLDELIKTYPDATVETLPEHSLIMPGLINPHIHLEFSANKTTLTYGGFMPWLHSVIEHREALINDCDQACMEKAVMMMLDSGITTFGAVSSHGMDLKAAENAPQNVVFFNEVIGSQATMADALFGDFVQRLDASEEVTREGFYPAIAIHSPYSVHPILVKRALQLAKEKNLPLSAHFMESPAEREWLDKNEGDFKPFFTGFLKQDRAVTTAEEFLGLFDDHPTLMTHVVHANDEELKNLAKHGHTVIHCPVSNRLLGNGAIDLDALETHNVPWLCGTDGLSSNYKLDLFEEMKIALFMHSETALLPLAKRLLKSVTVDAAKALGLNTGAIETGKAADMLVMQLDSEPDEQLPLHLLLHSYPLQSVHINGNKVKDTTC
ncbi:MAG: metal-dependent hydrolase [Campylobacterota bacterium]|nr:metal-dependent hydrolase [Campylobacterota bacterium]